jgi:hypothetical protein
MSFNASMIDNPWEFEAFVRQTTQRLFDTALHPRRQERNRQYRIGLLEILDGLANETPADVVEGVDRIAEQFPRVAAPFRPLPSDGPLFTTQDGPDNRDDRVPR